MRVSPSHPIRALGATVAPARREGGVDASAAEATEPRPPQGDMLELSPQALQLALAEAETSAEEEAPSEESPTGTRGADGEPLSSEEETQVRELQARDREVRTHEEAHKAAAGDLAISGPTYDYETGPDGQEYAVGGEVQIALQPGRDHEETVRNARRARRAALAPAEPSAQDHKVAAKAAQMEAKALQDASKEKTESSSSEDSSGAPEASAFDLARRDEAYRATAAG